MSRPGPVPPKAPARAAITLVFVSFGVAIGALAGSMPFVMRNAGIGPQAMGLGLTFSTLLTVLAMSAGGQLARIATSRKMLLAVLPAFALSLAAYLVSPGPVWLFIAIPFMGLCFGLTDLFMNAEAAALEHDAGRPIFLSFHGSVSAAVSVMAVATSVLCAHAGTWAVAMAAAACFGAAWVAVWCHVPSRPLAAGQAARIGGLPHRRELALLGVVAGLIIAAETAALLWSAKLLDDMAPSLAAISGLGAAFFGLCNTAVRFPGDRMRSLFGNRPLVIGSLLVAISGFVILGASNDFALSVVAFAVVGLGVALLIPVIFSLAAERAAVNRAGALSFVSLLTAVPRIGAPAVFGWIAGGYGAGAGFWVVAAGLVFGLGHYAVYEQTTARRSP